LEELLFLMTKEKQLRSAMKDLSLTARYQARMKVLRSVPAIGPIAAMTLLTELGDISRFKSLDQLSSYCGLTPNTYSSGMTERVTGLSRRGNPIVKTILIECAWLAVRKDPALLLYYKQLLPRMVATKAIIKVARKLLNRIRFVLKTNAEYVTGIVA
jgi:transposase